jgi:hypothetical protein
MSPEDRFNLIDQLNRSFLSMPVWAQTACKHAMGAPSHHPLTGEEFITFKEVIEAADDSTLEMLRQDFTDNDDLLPAHPLAYVYTQ